MQLKDCSIDIELDEGFIFRQLDIRDYESNYFELLSQLSIAPKVEYDYFVSVISDKNVKIFVVEDLKTKMLIATVRLNFERKLIRNAGSVCHFEDFVVDQKYRSKGIGAKIIKFSQKFAEQQGCYKILGICAEQLMPYYEKQDFKRTGFVFGKYFI